MINQIVENVCTNDTFHFKAIIDQNPSLFDKQQNNKINH